MMKRKISLGVMILSALVLAFTFSAYAEDTTVEDVGVQENASNAYDELMSSFPVTYSDEGYDEKIYPDYYGGAYINDDDQLVVYIVDNEERPVVLSDNENVIYESCLYSYNELLDVMDDLNYYKFNMTDTIANNFNEFGLYDSENRVIVNLDDLSADSIQEFKDNVCDSEAIVFKQGYGPVETETKAYVAAGSAISYSGGSASLGYRVKKGGTVGFITAGHAADSIGKMISYNGSTIAKCSVTQQSGNADAAFCLITDLDYTLTNTLYGTNNTLSTTISEPGVGTVINKVGDATGYTSGKITSINKTTTFTSGATISNLTSADYTSAPGDSGGVVYSYISSTNTRYTLGIHTGANSSTGTRYYTKANEINKALGTTRF